MASIQDLTKQNIDLTNANLRMYDETESDLAGQINAMLASQDSMLKHEAALGISKAAEAYGTAAGGGELNKRYYLTQRENPSALIAAMGQLSGLKGQLAQARAGERGRELANALNLEQLGLQQQQLKQQEASTFEKIMAGVGGVASIASLFSTEDAKKNIKKAPNTKLLADVKNMKIKEFEYKPGLGPMGKRIGMIIEDNPAEFERGQKTVTGSDLYNFIGKLTGAIQALDEKVNKIKGDK